MCRSVFYCNLLSSVVLRLIIWFRVLLCCLVLSLIGLYCVVLFCISWYCLAPCRVVLSCVFRVCLVLTCVVLCLFMHCDCIELYRFVLFGERVLHWMGLCFIVLCCIV